MPKWGNTRIPKRLKKKYRELVLGVFQQNVIY